MTTTVMRAGLVDGDNLCVNAILVDVDDDTDEVVEYTPADGLTLHLSDDAGVGKTWNGSAFV